MRLVIADTSPINYWILIGHIDLLPQLFERVALPDAVEVELFNLLAPQPVRRWIARPLPCLRFTTLVVCCLFLAW